MAERPSVFIVDDDESARDSVCALVNSMGLQALPFRSAEEFLDSLSPDASGCVVTDVRMVGMSGVELAEQLANQGSTLPVIVLTAFAHTQLTVRAMKAGAVTILDKPCDDDTLWDAIRAALALGKELRRKRRQRDELLIRIASLTPSELEVLEQVIAGTPNKAIANRLGVSVRTIENRRREIFRKMQAHSLADLVRLVLAAREIDP